MRLTLATALVVGMTAALPRAEAASIVHDTIGEYASLTFSGGGTVSAARSVAASMFDGDAKTIRSIGLGGTFVAGIGTDRVITSITLSELTFGIFSNHREAVTLSLGLDTDGDGAPDSGWTEIGVLRNDEWRNPNLPPVTSAPGQTAAVLSGVFGGDVTSYVISVTSGEFNLLRLLDGSPSAPGRDGFDIGELRVTSDEVPTFVNPVPTPSALALFASGLFCLGFAGRLRTTG